MRIKLFQSRVKNHREQSFLSRNNKPLKYRNRDFNK